MRYSKLYWFAFASRARDSNIEMKRSVICSRRFFEAFVDLFGEFFLCLKDHFCVSRIVLSHAKIHNSDGRLGEGKIV